MAGEAGRLAASERSEWASRMAAPGERAGPARELEALAESLGPFSLRPRCFLVAWSGVLALAYDGWPAEVEGFKAQLHSALQAKAPESPGSIWPKTSLGALQAGRRLAPEDLETLRRICVEASEELRRQGEAATVAVCELHATTFLCRSHERLFCAAGLPLRGPAAGPASEASRRNTDSVIAEYSGEKYWFEASRDGSREAHYRDAVVGSSLVAFLPGDPAGAALLRQRVDAALPGYYAWFSEPSLHCTVRGLA